MEPILFHGETEGRVSDGPPSFEASPMYPWLTPATFNGWFVPNGQSGLKKTLGEMEFEESLVYDFRARSLNLLSDEYDKLNAAANIGSNFITTRPIYFKDEGQLELGLSRNPPIICVIGYKCAGKTTFAHVAQSTRDVVHLEASVFFRNRIEQEDVSINGEDDTLAYMNKSGFDAVARSMVEHLDNLSNSAVIITDFRTPEEILLVRNLYPTCVVVSITADDRTRYERNVRRGREANFDTFQKFQSNDSKLALFGLMGIMTDVCDYVITNDGTLESFIEKVRGFLSSVESTDNSIWHSGTRSEVARCLLALQSLDRVATCDQISVATSSDGPRIRRYNVNRALKSVPLYARRVVKNGQLLSYESTGRTAVAVELIIDAKEFNPASSSAS
jgi:dephospho-CoA kinase